MKDTLFTPFSRDSIDDAEYTFVDVVQQHVEPSNGGGQGVVQLIGNGHVGGDDQQRIRRSVLQRASDLADVPPQRDDVVAGVDVYTGATRLRRILTVGAAGRIINPVAARSPVVGAMTMGVDSALMEELAVDTRFGLFINHDLASYEEPEHADLQHQDVVFLDELDDKANPMKARGAGELGLCGVGATVANAMYNATGVRLRDYRLTLDKHFERLPAVA